ncbi:hypothetical protein K438DRAFT_1855217 [Mycena galopus ATCC 62051]|nr:hypothetical protein K438DRAFT_1855217 [Mycena galopus ATCC 62051]
MDVSRGVWSPDSATRDGRAGWHARAESARKKREYAAAKSRSSLSRGRDENRARREDEGSVGSGI